MVTEKVLEIPTVIEEIEKSLSNLDDIQVEMHGFCEDIESAINLANEHCWRDTLHEISRIVDEIKNMALPEKREVKRGVKNDE